MSVSDKEALIKLARSMRSNPPVNPTTYIAPTRSLTTSQLLPSFGRKPSQPICISRGKELPLRLASCSYCALRNMKINVWSCEIHGSCVDEFDARYRVTGVRKCQECEHYKSPNIPLNNNPPTMTTINNSVLNINTDVKETTVTPTFNRTFNYGITTIPERRTTTLPITLKSLINAGFTDPILFIDDRDDGGWGLEYDMVTPPLYLGLKKVFRTDGRVRAFGHWVLSLWELFIRNPHADLYALFQDDIIVSRNLRLYLDSITFPHRGYINLYTFPSNQKVAPPSPGFYKSNQNGKSATALVFDRESIVTILSSPHTIAKLRSRNHRAWKSIDGGVIQAFKDASPVGQWHEYVHNPSLIQHIGDKSTLGNPDVIGTGDPNHWKSTSFRGEDFDCMTLLQQPSSTSTTTNELTNA